MGAVGGWWGRRTRWQQFLLVLLVVGAAYFAYTLIRGPAEDNVSVYTIASSGDGDEQLVAEGRDPAWSPDGQTLALTLPGDTSDEIGVIEIGGTEATSLADGSNPAWSPDGTTLAYVAEDEDGTSGIYLVDAGGGGEPTFLTEGNHPAWAPGRDSARLRRRRR